MTQLTKQKKFYGRLLLILVTSFALTSLPGCFERGHSHGGDSHSHDNNHQQQDSKD